MERLIDALDPSITLLPADESAPFPDAMIHVDGRVIGIEVTDYQRTLPNDHEAGSALRQEHELKNDLVRRAREEYERRSSPPIAVQVIFRPSRISSIKDARRQDVALQLADFLTSIPSPDFGGSKHVWHSEPRLLEPIDTVFVRRAHEEERGTWEVVEAHTTGPLRASDLNAAIERKNMRLRDYRAVCGECWLLVVADCMTPAGTITVPDRDDVDFSTSAFDRTFLLIEPDGLVFDSKDRP